MLVGSKHADKSDFVGTPLLGILLDQPGQRFDSVLTVDHVEVRPAWLQNRCTVALFRKVDLRVEVTLVEEERGREINLTSLEVGYQLVYSCLGSWPLVARLLARVALRYDITIN
jgi:hypothetical protein